MKKPRNIIGGQLQKIRLEKDISQMELSAINQRKGWNISRYIIAKIESGSRCVTDFEMVLLAESLQIRVADLFPSPKVWSAHRKHFMSEP
jgi:transcriptional regulator with XRE-family HTH domain